MANGWVGEQVRRETYDKGWRKLQGQIIRRDKGICQIHYDDICIIEATEVDHIDNTLLPNGKKNNHPTNLRAACEPCHARRTGKQGAAGNARPNPRPTPENPGYTEVLLDENSTETVIYSAENHDKSKWYSTIGPMWDEVVPDEWNLPEHTLGWYVLTWGLQNLLMKGDPFQLTGEQSRFVLWLYAIDELGHWLYNKAVKVAPKGFGKDPMAAFIASVEFVGPCRFAGWEMRNGVKKPKVRSNPEAWVQIVAVSEKQNENTWRWIRNIFTEKLKTRCGIEAQEKRVFAFNRTRRLEMVTSSARGLDGNPVSCVIGSEWEHWLKGNGMIALYEVVEGNVGKVIDAHMIGITNAYNPGEDSVAQRLIEGALDVKNGITKDNKTLIDMKYATEYAPYDTHEHRMEVMGELYGESSAWVDLEAQSTTIADVTSNLLDNLRKYYNAFSTPADLWINIRRWDECGIDIDVATLARPGKKLTIVMGFDGSLNDDSTALIGIVVGGEFDGLIFPLGIWEIDQAALRRGEKPQIDRLDVDKTVHAAFRDYKVIGFAADPSHRVDETDILFWTPYVNNWHREYGKRISPQYWTMPSVNAIKFDMTSFTNQTRFITALDEFEAEITAGTILQNRDPVLRSHVQNARRVTSSHGHTVAKPAKKSPYKIDGLVAATIAFMMYNMVRNNKRTPDSQIALHTPAF